MGFTSATQPNGCGTGNSLNKEIMSDGVENYGWNGAEGPHSCGYISPKVIELLRQRQHIRKVCDLGSGNGALAGQLHKAGYSVCGVEYDQEGCRIAHENHPTVDFYNLGVQDDPTPIVQEHGLFDAVVSTEVVEHLFSPHLLPIFARKLLKPGGVAIISTPYHGYWKNLALSLLNKWDHHHTVLWHGGHIKFFSRATLTKLLEDNGFRVVAFHGVGRLPFLWKSMILVAEAV